ncbi:MAG TPA: hypothetical protein DC057_02340 [Spirochaetia bacterium]|nr:hypothetical protein [Spirochaetia bacterium]
MSTILNYGEWKDLLKKGIGDKQIPDILASWREDRIKLLEQITTLTNQVSAFQQKELDKGLANKVTNTLNDARKSKQR